MSDKPAQGDLDENLDRRIRRIDPDRWLASRFVSDRTVRAEVVAVYALNDELARIGPGVKQPLAGEIRLAWWRERIEAIETGAEEALVQPVLQALAPAISSGRLPNTVFDAMIEARHADLGDIPFADDTALARYLDGTAGAVMALVARLLDPQAPLQSVVAAGRAWGLAGLYRAHGAWRAHGRSWVPESWGDPDDTALAARVASETEAALHLAQGEVAALSVRAFPAVAYATLATAYARGRPPGEIGRRVRLLKAVLTGRL